MTLAAGCPRCTSPVTEKNHEWVCPDHGTVTPLWRPDTAGYEDFADHLNRCAALPSFLPWPITPGWAITDFGCVATPGKDARAAFVSCAGPTDLDGVVEVTVISEEPGVGLGARCAGWPAPTRARTSATGCRTRR
nr:DUF6758 family protein [Nocardioides mesophilus]